MQDNNFYNKIYTNAELLRYVIAPLSVETSNKSFKNTLRKMLSSPVKSMLYVINSKLYKQRVGIIGIKWNQSNKAHVEIGIIIVENYQRQGFAYKAKTLLIKYVFEKSHVSKIIAICDKGNKAANHSFKKLGFISKKALGNNKVLWKKTHQ